MNTDTLNSIREAEKESHLEVYSTAKLFESGSWLQKPVKTVLDILPCFKNYKELNVLDLGCGVGRNRMVFKGAHLRVGSFVRYRGHNAEIALKIVRFRT